MRDFQSFRGQDFGGRGTIGGPMQIIQSSMELQMNGDSGPGNPI